MHVKKSHSRINSLQTVRALAFLGIFSQHCGVGSLGALGVSVFLILSGFLMYYSYFDREIGHTFKECVLFSYTKISKLYPMHICMGGAALVFVAIEIVRTMEANYVRYIFEIVMNVFLLQAWIPNRTIYYSLNGVAWYLSVCTFIYAMFPCILARLKRLDTVKQAMVILISVYFLQIGTALLLMGCGSNSLLKWYVYICPIYRLGDFCIGCCLGYLYVNHSFSFSKKIATLLEIATCLFLCIYQVEVIRKINNPMVNAFYTPLAISIVLMFALHKGAITNVLQSRLLQYIGNVSPYLFLTHQMAIKYIKKVIAIVFGVQNTFWQSKTVLIILALCVSIIVSECYLFLERKAKNKASRKY